MKGDINDQVATYGGLIESLAPKFVGRNDAELDDLVQEGRIFVWQSLERKVPVSAELIEARMNDWTRLLGSQIGRGRGKDGVAISYAELLPLDDYVDHDFEMDISVLDDPPLTWADVASAEIDSWGDRG